MVFFLGYRGNVEGSQSYAGQYAQIRGTGKFSGGVELIFRIKRQQKSVVFFTFLKIYFSM
jgi:hypothetical protein